MFNVQNFSFFSMNDIISYKNIEIHEEIATIINVIGFINDTSVLGFEENQFMDNLRLFLFIIGESKISQESIEYIKYFSFIRFQIKRLSSYSIFDAKLLEDIFSIIANNGPESVLTADMYVLMISITSYFKIQDILSDQFLFYFSQTFQLFNSQEKMPINYIILNLAIIFFERNNIFDHYDLFSKFIYESLELSLNFPHSTKLVQKMIIPLIEYNINNIQSISCLISEIGPSILLEKARKYSTKHIILELFLNLLQELNLEILKSNDFIQAIITVISDEINTSSSFLDIKIKIIDKLIFFDLGRFQDYFNIFSDYFHLMIENIYISEEILAILTHIISMLITKAHFAGEDGTQILHFVISHRSFIIMLINHFDHYGSFTKHNIIQIIAFIASHFHHEIIHSNIIFFFAEMIISDTNLNDLCSLYLILNTLIISSDQVLLIIIQSQMVDFFEYFCIDEIEYNDINERDNINQIIKEIFSLFMDISNEMILI